MKQEGFHELRIFTENNELKKVYQEKVKSHNNAFSNDEYTDAGFDLFIPKNLIIESGQSQKIDHEINCAMVYHTYKEEIPKAYFLYPRSSTGLKTPLRLANSVGIIDSGYRGNIIAVFDNLNENSQFVNKGNRLVQICGPNLEPFIVTIVENKEDLGITRRGSCGFGSTGN